jgi:hypothetical protein
MSQEISTLSPPAFIETWVRSFIYEDLDGSQRLNESGLAMWLSEQFGYATQGGAAPTTKQAEAAAIAQRLAAVVNRETFQSHPSYPAIVAGGDIESTRTRLIELRTEMYRQVQAITNPFRDFDASLGTRIKSMFNSMVLPSFPAGVKLIETTRAYVETFTTDWGEESAPSPVSTLATLDQNDTATVTGSAAPAGRHITKRRLYRSATGTTQSAFRLQGEYPIAQTVILDDKLDEHLNEPCPTFGWLEPPAGLQGLIGMPNGMMLGFVGRTLYACEPYHPYAYPAKYDKPLPYNIVGLAQVGQSVFVGTTGRPYLVSGSDAASLSEEVISSNVPCASAQSMVAIGGSVFYASPNGLALYESGKVTIVTKQIFDRAAWQAYQPHTMRATEYDGRYLAFFTRADSSRGAIVFDYETRTVSELDQAADAVFGNEDGVYALLGSTIYDVLPADGANRTGHWHSKDFRLTRPQSFGWIHVDARTAPFSATVRIYADDVLHETKTITSRAPVRCKPGRYANWRVEIESTARIEGVVLATTTEELKAAL